MPPRKSPSPHAAADSAGRLPVYVIYGAESFLRLEALQGLLRKLLGDPPDAMCLAEFDGPTTNITTVLDELRTPSLLSPMRVVLVRDADLFIRGDPNATVRNRDLLHDYLAAPDPAGTLILVSRTWQRNTRLYKLVEQIGRNISCEPPKANEIPAWVVARARHAHGVSLDAAASRRLAELVGAHLGILDMELSKLATFVAPQTNVTTADVERLVDESREEVVFRITDAIARADAPGALAVWDQVLSTDRSAPYRSVGGLAYAFRRLAQAKRLVGQGVSVGQAAAQVGYRGYPSGLESQIRRFTLAEWYDLLVQLLKIDLESKTSLGEVRTNVEKLVVGLCT